MAEIELRPARLEEAGALARMSRDWIEVDLPWRYTPPRVRSHLRDPETQGVVAARGAEIVGFALMQFLFRDARAHLLLLAVDPAQRRRGIGSGLLRWLDPLARLGGVERITLEVRAGSLEAQRFYAAQGYTERRRLAGYYDQREDAICMERSLARTRERSTP